MTQTTLLAAGAEQATARASFPYLLSPQPQAICELLLYLNGFEADGDLTYTLERPDLWVAAYVAHQMTAEDYRLEDIFAMYNQNLLHGYSLSLSADATCLSRARMLAHVTGIKCATEPQLSRREANLLSNLSSSFPV